ncbi:elongation factor P 5-aminopentanone reductase [Falsibacillus albus]|uniref:SDR family oxidoreductase n=1 Tax=Falsibacillus albus TaxID=2478915 RepID=A0A3L7JXQ8_9BACI|nr:SDR family oxidoreductase [Falsibacillus albus]RLQ95678.1 SDR family oxidoreductase [Falsibacillus albus]
MKKFALITGASGGIGRAAAKSLAKEGWNLYLHYHQNEEACKTLMEELSPLDLELIPIKADLNTPGGIKQITDQLFELDAIVYTCGTSHYGLFVDTATSDMKDMMTLHVESPMILIQQCLPKLMRKDHSSIVLISSIWGQTGAACEVLYSTVKGAQIAFVKALSKEVARSGVRINAVAPGAVETRMMSGYTDEELKEIEDDIPMGRIARPDEIAEAVLFLISPKSSYMTGQVMAVNGGWHT